MKVMFCYINVMGIPYCDLRAASLSAILKANGHETSLLDFTFNLSHENALAQLKEFNPDILCMSARSTEFLQSVKFAEFLRKNNTEIPIFVGGSHPTIDPEDAISHKCFDGICIGEGEHALLELVEKIEKGHDYINVKNFWFNKGNKVIKNPVRPLIENLDDLPMFDYDIFDMKKYLKARNGQFDYIATRGCPFQCTFCINPTMQNLYKGSKFVRYLSIDRIIKDLKILSARYNIREIIFFDETFNMNIRRLKEFSEKYPKEINIPFECDARADLCNEEVMQLLKKSNCNRINLAIESGDPEMRNKLLKKNISDQQIINAFHLAKKYGINTMSLNMIGLPLETKEQIKKTIELNKKAMPDSLQVSIFNPFPGSELYEFCKKKNLLRKKDYSISYYTGTSLYNPNITEEEMLNIRERFAYESYKDRSKLKAYLLYIRESLTPYYLRHGNIIPVWFFNLIYKIFFSSKLFNFMRK
ncbi:radical SAM protein [Candidatus Woesearchaeota archaeon]|nr:radical SAM protein [Candidatus Woesearchaeota archaeon]